MTAFLDWLARQVWGIVPSAAILAAGLALCCRLRWRQLTGLRRLGRAMRQGGGEKPSVFEMFSLTAGGKMGVGNIVGVAVALSAGGAGAIFWMGVYAVIGAGISYCECRLGARLGGTAVYMKKLRGLGWAAGIFTPLLFLSQAVLMPMVQINSAALEITGLTGGGAAVGLAAAGLAAAVFLLFSVRGEKATAALAASVTPLAAGLYILLALAVIIDNIQNLPAALGGIFAGAFELRSVTGGLLGALTVGVRRSMFTGEAGYGIAPYAAATTGTDPEDVGLVQGFSVIFDTLIMCTLTALMLLCSGADSPAEAAAGLLGGIGRYVMAGLVALFAFTTLLCCGFTAAAPLGGAKRVAALLITAGSCVAAGAAAPQAVWAAGDICGALMAWLNIAALLVYEFGGAKRLKSGESKVNRLGG